MSSEHYRHINLEAIHDIADGDNEFVKEIVSNSFEAISESTQNLRQAIQASDSEQIVFFAHKLKGTFAFIGATKLERLALAMETDAANFRELENSLSEMTALFEETEVELRSVMNELHE